MPGFLLPLLIATLYGALAAHFWRCSWHRPERGLLPGRKASAHGWARVLLAVPLALHAAALYQGIFHWDGWDLGLGNALSALTWLTLAVYWAVNLRYDMAGMMAMVLPLAAIGVLLPVVLPASHVYPQTSPLFAAHMAVAMLAYSLLTIAALHAGLMALVERRLHEKTLLATFAGLPPLLTMERLLFRLLGAGFVLLTLALGSGILFSEELFGRPLQFTHKTVFALLSWATFAALLVGRHFRGWRGRTAIRWTLSGFALLLLGYLGSKLVLEVLLQRA